jgi:FMN phosphatase YigB (HAD superfamily)
MFYHSMPHSMPHHSTTHCMPVLELADVMYTAHDGHTLKSRAFIYNNMAYLEAFRGDNWAQYEVLTSQPVEPNNPQIQEMLDKFYPGWGSHDPMGETLRRLGYRLPQAP